MNRGQNLAGSWHRIESAGVPWMAAYQTFDGQHKSLSESVPPESFNGVL
jgi:hypothetical protein